MNKSPGIVELVVDFSDTPARPRNYDPSRLYPRELTDDEVLARIEFLKADNARLKAKADERSRVRLDQRAKPLLSDWYGGNR